MAPKLCVFSLALLACISRCHAYPAIFVARYAQHCTDHPASNFGKVHTYTKEPDRTVTFTLQPVGSDKAVAISNGAASVCAGGEYDLKVAFGEPALRNSLLTTTHGQLITNTNDCDAWCPNRVCSPAAANQATAVLSLPCSLADSTKVTIKVTSANGRIPASGSNLRSAVITAHVKGKCPGQCSAIAAAKVPGQSATSAKKSGG